MKEIVSLMFCVLLVLHVRSQGVLHTSGKTIIDSSGHEVILRGVNLGGWLVSEDWMCGTTDTTDSGGRSVRKTLETRFDSTQVKQLFNTWEDNWITSADIDTIRAIGFNFMRVPFGWRNLQDQNQQWYLDSMGHVNFSRLDWIVAQAALRNMYVLLDYHIWLDQDLAYNGISGTDSVVRSTCKIWKAVASHFGNNATVAGYDILNEPTSSAGEYVKQMIYDTIRSVDPAHMISMEWTAIDTVRWHNVLYQDHWYGMTAPTLDSNQTYFDGHYLPILRAADSLGVPYYIGETHVENDSGFAWSLDQYCLHHTSWSPWTYKTINEWGWGLISLYPNNVRVNAVTDPFDTILSRWGRVSNAGNWYELQNVKTMWAEAAQCENISSGIHTASGDTEISIYPNPANTFIQVVCTSDVVGSRYYILNMLGESISSGEMTEEMKTIEIGGLANGVYFLKIDAAQPLCFKFIKV